MHVNLPQQLYRSVRRPQKRRSDESQDVTPKRGRATKTKIPDTESIKT